VVNSHRERAICAFEDLNIVWIIKELNSYKNIKKKLCISAWQLKLDDWEPWKIFCIKSNKIIDRNDRFSLL